MIGSNTMELLQSRLSMKPLVPKKILEITYRLAVVFMFAVFITSCSLQKKYKNFKGTFLTEIEQLERLDDIGNKKDYVLFIGSSSIRLWDRIEDDMAPYTVVKRGYGGAHYYDLIHYISRLVAGHNNAKAIILFVANDITGKQSWDTLHRDLAPAQVKRLFKAVSKDIHKTLNKNIPIFVIETTPTPARWAVWEHTSKANNLIKRYTEKTPHLNYISTRDFFINKDGIVNANLFLKDSLHLNYSGYKLWSGIIKHELYNNSLTRKLSYE